MNGVTILATEAGGLTGLTEAVGALLDVAVQALDVVTAHPVLFVSFAAGIVFSGIGIIKALK